MKKIFRFNEKELVDIYTIALDSFVPTEEVINMNKTDYLAIDMSTTFFDNISQEGKQQILDYFKNKYNIEVMNASLDTLKEKGLTSNGGKYVGLISNEKRGILLGILNEKIVSETEVVIEGYWFLTAVAAAGFSTTIVFKDGQWKLQKTGMIWVS